LEYRLLLLVVEINHALIVGLSLIVISPAVHEVFAVFPGFLAELGLKR
jgi:hypothetical protein